MRTNRQPFRNPLQPSILVIRNMHFFSTATVALAALAAEVVGRQITVVNNCAYTVWYVLVVVILSAR